MPYDSTSLRNAASADIEVSARNWVCDHGVAVSFVCLGGGVSGDAGNLWMLRERDDLCGSSCRRALPGKDRVVLGAKPGSVLRWGRQMTSSFPDSQQELSDWPVVSVIVPTFNRSSTIADTLASAVSQTYPAVEIVVVDDGSTDDTQSVLEAFSSRVLNIHQENRGVAAARNTGIEASHGSIVMFLDSDDLWVPTTVMTMAVLLQDAGGDVPCGMCDLTMNRLDGTSVSMFDDRRLRPRSSMGLWTNVQEILTTRFLFTNQTLAIRRKALEAVGLFDESLWVMEDFELAMRLSTLGPWAYTTRALATHHAGSPDSLTAQADKDPKRLNTTILAICRKMQLQDVPKSRLARFAIAYMARKAIRRLGLLGPERDLLRTFRAMQAFVEEGILERIYRNSGAYPRLRSKSFKVRPQQPQDRNQF